MLERDRKSHQVPDSGIVYTCKSCQNSIHPVPGQPTLIISYKGKESGATGLVRHMVSPEEVLCRKIHQPINASYSCNEHS